VAEHLFIEIDSNGEGRRWLAVDGEGRLLGAPQTGSLEAVAEHAANRKLVLLAPGFDVVTTQAELPATSHARMRQILPYSIEDSFAEDVDRLSFAVGSRLPSGAMSVSVVSKELLRSWLQRAQDAGLRLSAVYAATDGVPDTPSTLNIIVDDDAIYGRRPGQPPIALQGLSLSQAFDFLSTAGEEAETQHAVVYVGEHLLESLQAELALIESRLSSLSVKVIEDGVLPRFASKLVNAPGTNLLQGEFAVKSDWAALVKPWRLAASLIVGLMVLTLLGMGIEYAALRAEDRRLTAALEQECQDQFSSGLLSQCATMVQNALRLAGDSSVGSGDGFLATLGTLAEYAGTDKRFEMLSYRNQVMSLQVVAPDVEALDRFRQDISDTGRFDATIQSTNPDDDAVEGRMQIVGTPQ